MAPVDAGPGDAVADSGASEAATCRPQPDAGLGLCRNNDDCDPKDYCIPAGDCGCPGTCSRRLPSICLHGRFCGCDGVVYEDRCVASLKGVYAASCE